MAEEHLSERTLLAYVEDELGGGELGAVETHLAACETCARDVAAVRRGRDALRAAPPLELPAGVRERAIASFPRQETPVRGPARRWLALAAPTAAALALVGGVATLAISTSGDGGDDAAQGIEESAGSATQDGGEAGGSTGPGPALGRLSLEARELARDLREQGFDARVERGTVVVRTSRKAALEKVLADYPRDAVRDEVRVRVEKP